MIASSFNFEFFTLRRHRSPRCDEIGQTRRLRLLRKDKTLRRKLFRR
jgi:hypothetical protein